MNKDLTRRASPDGTAPALSRSSTTTSRARRKTCCSAVRIHPSPNLVPSDIEFSDNYCSKPLSWRMGDPSYAGFPWLVKNVFELKNAQRVLVARNVFEYAWTMGQTGIPILFTVRNQDGKAPWSTVQDVTFASNIVRHANGGVNVLGTDNINPSQTNIAYDIWHLACANRLT